MTQVRPSTEPPHSTLYSTTTGPGSAPYTVWDRQAGRSDAGQRFALYDPKGEFVDAYPNPTAAERAAAWALVNEAQA